MTRTFRNSQTALAQATPSGLRPRRPAGAALFAARMVAALGLAAFLACGGGGGGSTPAPPPKTIADTLTYSNPSGTYALVKNTSKSTATHLVLDLVGPAGSVSGVGFYLSADQTKVTWTTVDSGDAEKVKSSTFSNTLVKSKVSGDTLQAGVYQKGTTAAVTATASTVLASVALDLKSGVAVGANANLTAVAGKALILNAPANATPTSAITLAVGSLTAN